MPLPVYYFGKELTVLSCFTSLTAISILGVLHFCFMDKTKMAYFYFVRRIRIGNLAFWRSFYRSLPGKDLFFLKNSGYASLCRDT